jgi:outer membrane immunogenic protein
VRLSPHCDPTFNAFAPLCFGKTRVEGVKAALARLQLQEFIMKRANIAALAGFGVLALTGLANAADMVDEVPQAPEAVIPDEPVKGGWSGFYAGVYGGYSFGKFDDAVDIKANGFKGGAFTGYNYQTGPYVLGLDADLGYGGAKADLGATGSVKQGTNGALRARLGYDVGPALIYGAAGGTATSVTANDGAVEDSKIHAGWTVGAGIDAKLTDKVFARGEYRYNSYQSQDYTLTAPASVGLKQHDVRFGVGLQF